MLQANFTYHLLQLLLDRLEAEGHTFGVDMHLRLHELLKQLPDDYPPKRLKTLLAPLLAKSRESQQDFYDLFDEIYKEVSDIQNWQAPTETVASTEERAEKRSRWLVILLGAALFIGLLTVWKLTQQVIEADRWQFQQTVALYDSTSVFVMGDTLLEQVNQVVFQANGRSDSLNSSLVHYTLNDSLRLVLFTRDTVGTDSVTLLLSNPAGDTLRWTVKSVLRPRPKVAVSKGRIFLPIDSLPYPHDIFSLAAEQPTPTEVLLKQYLPWIKAGLLLLATALLLALLVWRERRRRKLVAEIEQSNQPPYVWNIKFPEPAEIDFGDELAQLFNQLRQRTDAESRELDVSASINATVKSGGMVDFRYRQRTRPPEYLLLIDEQSQRNHRARLFDELYERFKAEEILISRYFYHGDLRRCFNEEHPHGISLPELSGKYPDTRLLIVGSGEGLLSPINGRLTKWSELLTRWSERALLSPVPSSEWGRREEQLHPLLPVLPANLRSLSFLIDQLDEGEEGEIDKWQQATRHQALPPLRLGAGGLLSSLQAHLSPELLNWLAACAVYPRLQFELTCQLGKLLSSPEQNLLTSDNLTRLNQLPWFVQGSMPTAVRMILLNFLEDEQPALLLRVREFLHTSLETSAPPAESAAANEHHLQLALNEWLFTQDQQRKAELEKEIAQQLRAGAEADFTVIKFQDRERSLLDFIVPDRWKRYFSYSDYPALDWRELKQDLHWTLPLWGLLAVATICFPLVLTEECTGETVTYQEQTLCLDSPEDELWYYERLALDTIQLGELSAADSLFYAMQSTIEVASGSDLLTLTQQECYANLATLLYNQGVPLYLEQRDSACQYFSRAAEVDTAAAAPWTRAAKWCIDSRVPLANFELSTKNCCAPCEISMYDQSTNVSVSSWDFGDGSLAVAIKGGTTTTHTYTNPGTYTVTLVATNTDDQRDTISQTVEIRSCIEDEVNPAYRGRVIDASTREPIPNATIQAGPSQDIRNQDLASQSSLRTDDQGYYTIAAGQWSGRPDELQMRISATGYRDTILRRRTQAELATIMLTAPPTPGTTGGENTTTSGAPAPATPVPATSTIADIAKNMEPITGGTFTMGCQEGRDTDCFDSEKPAHEVTLSSFSISKYEVTQAQWRSVMGSAPPGLANSGCDQCPVERVSWDDIQEFLQKLNAETGQNYRLPTEAEWEYAARGGNKSEGYEYSGSNDVGEVAWYSSNAREGNTDGSEKTTRPVGGKKPNELGLYDMSGNVWEWCSDWYGDYSSSAQQNPRGPGSGSSRVNRGGGWYVYPQYCRAAHRGRDAPTGRNSGIGFRLARS